MRPSQHRANTEPTLVSRATTGCQTLTAHSDTPATSHQLSSLNLSSMNSLGLTRWTALDTAYPVGDLSTPRTASSRAFVSTGAGSRAVIQMDDQMPCVDQEGQGGRPPGARLSPLPAWPEPGPRDLRAITNDGWSSDNRKQSLSLTRCERTNRSRSQIACDTSFPVSRRAGCLF